MRVRAEAAAFMKTNMFDSSRKPKLPQRYGGDIWKPIVQMLISNRLKSKNCAMKQLVAKTKIFENQQPFSNLLLSRNTSPWISFFYTMKKHVIF